MNKLWCFEKNSFVAQVGDATSGYSVSTFPPDKQATLAQSNYNQTSVFNLNGTQYMK